MWRVYSVTMFADCMYNAVTLSYAVSGMFLNVGSS